MPDVDLAALRAEMETEREWREAEMRLFRNQVESLTEEGHQKTARKALVVMLYAHFEGVTKALLTMYVNCVNAVAITIGEAAPAVGVAALDDVFHAMRDGNKKCKEFVRLLPDDTALHRFSREREFVEVAWQIASRSLKIDPDRIVDTESNLKPVVLRKILFRLGLALDLADPWEATIHQLLHRRNDVAHGSARMGLEKKDYAELEQAVNLVVEGLVQAISEAVSNQAYRLSVTTAVAAASARTLVPM